MKPKLLSLIGSILLIGIVVPILFYITAYDQANIAVNNFFNSNFNPVDRSCKTDADCTIEYTQCSHCGPTCSQADDTWAVNKNWKPFCPVPALGGYVCPMISCVIRQPDVFCQQGVCKIKR